jgi:3-hydroxyacyl-[acyl-carrier-protein] dehydratase
VLELGIEEIQKVLPQQFPFLMIDRVIELDPGKRVVAIKNVSINEGFFSGHFPGKPVMPGVLIIEAMAQAMIMLFYDAKAMPKEKKPTYYLGAVKVRFFNPVFPGDQLKIIVEPLKILSGSGIVNATAEVNGKEAAKGEISFSVK